MGIEGLTGFIADYFERWENVTLTKATATSGGKLIVDGNSLCWRLLNPDWDGFIKIDCRHGGPFLQFKEAVVRIFELLVGEKVDPIVVMDGIDSDSKKLKVRLERRRNRVRPIDNCGLFLFQILFFEVFVATLKKLHVTLCVADGDADETIAKLANHHLCPVLAYDSDYYVFHLQAGYIPLDKLDIDTKPVQVKLYKVDAFAEQFGFKETSLIYTIPVIFGNDFWRPISQPWKESVKKMCGPTTDDLSRKEGINMVCGSVAQDFSSFEEFMKDRGEKGLKIQELYSIRETFSIEHLMKPESFVLTHHNGARLPDWLVTDYRNGYIPPYIIEAVVCCNTILPEMIDDVDRETSMCLSKQLRQCLYALLGCDEVTEYVRVGSDIVPRLLACRRLVGEISIPNILETEEVDPELLFAILDCKKEPLKRGLGRHYETWMLPSAVTIYWARKARVAIKLVRGLIACNILCWTDSQPAMICRTDVRRDLTRPEYKSAIHSFSQWQCVYHCTLALTSVLQLQAAPLPPQKLYDDKLALHLACDCKEIVVDSRVEQQVRPKHFKLYKHLTAAVFEQLPFTAVKTPMQSQPALTLSNRFDLLPRL